MTWEWTLHPNRCDYEAVFHEFRVLVQFGPKPRDVNDHQRAYRVQIFDVRRHDYLQSWPCATQITTPDDPMASVGYVAEHLVENWWADRVAERLAPTTTRQQSFTVKKVGGDFTTRAQALGEI